MSDKLVVPVVVHLPSRERVDVGATASLGKRVRDAASEIIKHLQSDTPRQQTFTDSPVWPISVEKVVLACASPVSMTERSHDG